MLACHGGGAEGTDRGHALASNRRLRRIPANEILGVIRNGRSGMPAFPLAQDQVQAFVSYIRSLNATALELPPASDAAAGERFFFGQGQRSTCHTAKGHRGANGPALSDIGRLLTLREIVQALDEAGTSRMPGYRFVSVQLRDGSSLWGFAQNQDSHDLQLQDLNGRLHLLLDSDYISASSEEQSLNPATGHCGGAPDLLAFLSYDANHPWKTSPMTYMVNGRQYVAIRSGENILSFALAGVY
jgi:mono/diheme cytochrome c family protein